MKLWELNSFNNFKPLIFALRRTLLILIGLVDRFNCLLSWYTYYTTIDVYVKIIILKNKVVFYVNLCAKRFYLLIICIQNRTYFIGLHISLLFVAKTNFILNGYNFEIKIFKTSCMCTEIELGKIKTFIFTFYLIFLNYNLCHECKNIKLYYTWLVIMFLIKTIKIITLHMNKLYFLILCFESWPTYL